MTEQKKCGMMYRGRPIEDYTKEELIEAIRTMHSYYRGIIDNKEQQIKLLEIKHA